MFSCEAAPWTWTCAAAAGLARGRPKNFGAAKNLQVVRWPNSMGKTWDAKLLSCGDTGYVVGSCQDFMAEEQLSTRF